ncbi:MAG: YxeA family protein [Peptococcaceae bacterium]|nr:YxeA family protein [Peptococcaceae bacterium]
MKRFLQVVLAAIVLLLAVAVVFFWTGIGSRDYYTQIDNSKCVAITPDAGMTHEYTLSAYDETGQMKEIVFRTERVLRDTAYLKLTVAPLRGVVSWEEIQLAEMPQAASERIGE